MTGRVKKGLCSIVAVLAVMLLGNSLVYAQEETFTDIEAGQELLTENIETEGTVAQKETVEKRQQQEVELSDIEENAEPAVGAVSNNWAWPTYVHSLKSDWPNYSSGSYHGGTDFPVPLNTSVYSSCDGEVVSVKYMTTSYGRHIKIKATVNGSTVYIRYCHLNSILVSEGDHVKAGQEIGKSGSTGNSSGPHLHYEVRNSADRYNPSLNPRLYLPGTSYSFESWDPVPDTCNCSDSYAGNYVVTTSELPLSIRSGHGTSYSKIGQIPKGTTVYVSKADGNWAHVEYNGVSGYCSMQYLSKKADVNIVMNAWFSTTGMGDAIGRCNNGDNLYLCYRLYDSNSGKNWDELENCSYSVKETIYNPDGSEKFSYTYNNDNNWIRIVPDKGGTYRGKIELTGDRTGTVECSVPVIERNDVFGGWLTSDAAGNNKISTVKKGQKVYFWYNVHDSNTGELLNQYRNWDYTMQQIVYKPDGSRLLERTYNKSDNGVLDFTPDTAGKYKCETIITLSNGTTTVNTKWLQVEKEEITASIAVSPSGSAASGSQVKLTAKASGGSGNYTYKFLVCDAKGNWYRLQDFGKSNTYTWTPGATGKKNLYVDVKDSDGTVKRAGIIFEVKNKALTASLSASPSGSAVSGSKVKLTAGAGGGSGNYTYKFLVCDAKGNWYKLQDFGKNNTYTWTPGATGKKTLYVDVKDSTGAIKRASMPYEIKNKNQLTAVFAADPTGSAKSGSEVLLLVKASGGSGKYTYKFLICDVKGNWYKLQDYSTDNACIWIPGATGKKTLYVDVKDSTGQYVRKQLSFTVTDKAKTMALESEEAAVVGETIDVFTDGEERTSVQTEELPSTEDTVFDDMEIEESMQDAVGTEDAEAEITEEIFSDD